MIKLVAMIISSSDVRCNAKNKMIITNKLKSTNSNVIVSTSDTSEEVNKKRCFLKGRRFAALWITIENHVDRRNIIGQKYG